MSKHSELDEILQMLKNELVWPNIAKQYEHLGAIDLDEAKQAILDWHNKQIEEVLYRIENSPNGANSGTQAHMMINEAIRSERNKLKESSNEPIITTRE